MPAIPIALIEDNAPYAEALRKFFRLPGSPVECRAIYGSSEEALEQLPADPPAVALVDINLPGLNGIECISRLKERCPQVAWLVLTMYEEDHLIFDALRAGACGYLLKRTPPAEIAEAIRVARDGGSPMSPHIARQVVRYFHQAPPPRPEQALTAREQEVLDLLIAGQPYKGIAHDLGVSIDTVRSHVRKVYDKLHIHSRTEIMLKFGKKGR